MEVVGLSLAGVQGIVAIATDLLVACAAIGTFAVAWSGVDSWRAQLDTQKRLEAAVALFHGNTRLGQASAPILDRLQSIIVGNSKAESIVELEKVFKTEINALEAEAEAIGRLFAPNNFRVVPALLGNLEMEMGRMLDPDGELSQREFDRLKIKLVTTQQEIGDWVASHVLQKKL